MMQPLLKNVRRCASTLAVAVVLAGALPNIAAFAQTAPPATTAAALPEPVIKALQEALNRQGIAVSTSGALNDETRSAIRKYQSQHHLPVSGEPDKATLDKLGVRQSAAPALSPALAQAAPTPPAGSPTAPAQAPTPPQAPMQPGQMPGGTMMNCPMMQGQMTQGQMQAMMQMMQGMMQMMQTMQGQMQPGQMQPGQMQPGQMQPGQMQPGQMPGGPRQN